MHITKKFNRILTVSLTGMSMLVMMAVALPASAESPLGCNADNSIVNISSDVLVASVGDTITFTVSAGNPASANGCDITNRTVTLTLPNGVVHVFGPSNYPNPTPTTNIGSVPYIASAADLVGGLWTANVSWNGTLKSVSDLSSSGAKNISVNEASDIVVTKTAVPESRVSYTWTIDKSVTPAVWNLFKGDSGMSEYTIVLDKSVGVQANAVNGVITINNPNDVESATIASVTDTITGVGAATVNCPVTLPHVLAPGATIQCTYTSLLPDTTTRTNTATVTTTGAIGGGSGVASIDFANVVPTEVNGTVSVDDTFAAGDHGPVSADTTYTYTRTFSCDADEGVINNTATIVGTQLSDSASVTVNCYDLTVTKTANTTFDRSYLWNVEKVADATEITLASGESYDIHYTVTATKTGETNTNHAVSGTITIANPNPTRSADLTGVADEISVALGATVVCPANVVAAASSLVCTYSSALPDGTSRTNTATATQQNYSYSVLGVATPAGTTAYSGQAPVVFGAPTNVVDEQVAVTDTYAGALGTVTVAESPKVFNYTRTVTFTDQECGDQTVDNTATLTTNDTQTVDTADERVLVHVECIIGCTLTQGYWKTHSIYGPAAHPDDNWATVGGPDAEFFLSGMSWLEVFKTAPKGNAYYNLAHQYMAAVLNANNEATVPTAVQDAIDDATAFFNTYTPDTFNALGKKSQVRKDVLTWAGILGSFNEGLTGPGHCDEDSSSRL